MLLTLAFFIIPAFWPQKALEANIRRPWSKGWRRVGALTSHQCGPGSNPGVDAICGLSLLLVLSLAPSGFSPGTPVSPSPQKPTFPNSNSTRNQVDEEPFCVCTTSKSLFNSFIFFYDTITELAQNNVPKTSIFERF